MSTYWVKDKRGSMYEVDADNTLEARIKCRKYYKFNPVKIRLKPKDPVARGIMSKEKAELIQRDTRGNDGGGGCA